MCLAEDAVGLQAAYTYTKAQQPAKDFLVALPENELVAMHKKICKGRSSAVPGDDNSGTSMLQSSPDNAASPNVKPVTMSASAHAKLQKEMLQTAKSQQHFLASITLLMLKKFLVAHLDIKPFEGQLKRTSDWVDIILKKWQNKDMDLQVRPLLAALTPLVD